MRLSNLYDVEPIASNALRILSEPLSVTEIHLNSRFIRELKPQVMRWLTSVQADPQIIKGYEKLFQYGDKLIIAKQADNEFVKTQDIDFWKEKVTKQAQAVENLITTSNFREQINKLVTQFNKAEDNRIRRYVDQSPTKAYL